MRKLGMTVIAAVAGLAMTGCGTIYSTQDYGAPSLNTVSAGASKNDVFANLGSPNSIYRDGDSEVFVYKHQTGTNILGLYATIKRQDTVVIFDDDSTVTWVATVPVGQGMTIVAPPGVDATTPVRTKELLFDPENFDYEE